MLWQEISNSSFPTLKNNQVHIWRISLEQSENELIKLLSLLNSQEKTRAAKFISKQAKSGFITARGTLRSLLAKYLHIKPQELFFLQNKYGKLYINNSSVRFNISHSHNFSLFIFAMHQQVGIDIEYIRDDFEFIHIAQRFFSEQEAKDLLALPKNQQLDAFFNCWSRKEAFIKAIGKGVFFDLNKFSVEISNKKAGQLQLQIDNSEFNSENWSLEALDPADGYVGAFAISYQKQKYETFFYRMGDAGIEPATPAM